MGILTNSLGKVILVDNKAVEVTASGDGLTFYPCTTSSNTRGSSGGPSPEEPGFSLTFYSYYEGEETPTLIIFKCNLTLSSWFGDYVALVSSLSVMDNSYTGVNLSLTSVTSSTATFNLGSGVSMSAPDITGCYAAPVFSSMINLSE